MARPKRVRRIVLISAGVLIGIVIIAIVTAPWIAAAIVPGKVVSAIEKEIDGSVEIERTRLSWFGAQRVGPIVVRDAAGVEAARLEATVSRGLLGLLTSIGKLGTVTVSGDATVIVDESGTSNVERILRLGQRSTNGGASTEPVSLPKQLAGTLVLDGVTLTYIDPMLAREISPDVEAAAIEVNAKAEFGVGRDIVLSLSSKAGAGTRASPSAKPLGALSLDATVTGLTDGAGVVHPDQATLKATLKADDLPLGLADSMAKADGWLSDAFGPSADVNMTLNASRTSADIDVKIDDASATSDMALAWDGARVRLSRPAKVSWAAAGLTKRMSDLASERVGRVEFESLPQVSVGIDAFDIGFDPTGAQRIDLRSGALSMHVDIGPINATVADESGPQAVGVSPRSIVLTSDDLASALSLDMGADTNVANEPAGAIEASLRLSGLADASGAPGMPGSVHGTINVTHAPTVLMQPFAKGVDLRDAIGPLVDLHVQATASTENLAAPSSVIDLSVNANNVQAKGKLTFDSGMIGTRDTGIDITIVNPSAGLADLLAQTPMRLTSSDAAVVGGQVSLDLASMQSGGRLSALKADVTVNIGATSGTHEGAAWTLAPTSIDAKIDSAGAIKLTSKGLTYDGHALSTIEASLTGPVGSTSWLPPNVTLNATIDSMSPTVLSLVPGMDRLSPADDIGDSITLTATAQGDPADLMSSTAATLTARSRELTLRSRVRIDNGVLRTDGDGVSVKLLHAGRFAGRFMPADAPAQFHTGGWVGVDSTNLTLPFENGAPNLDKLRGAIQITGGNLGADLDGGAAIFDTLRIGATFADSTRLDVNIAGKADGASIAIDGRFTEASALGDMLKDLKGVRPVGALTIKGAPTSLVAAYLPESQRGAAAIVLGETVEATVTSTSKSGSLDVVLSATGAHVNSNLHATVDAEAVELRSANVDVALPQDAAQRLIHALSPTINERVQTSRDVSLKVTASPLTIPFDAGLAGAGALDSTATLSTGATMYMTAKDGTVTTIGPIDVVGATASVSAPLGAFAGGGEGQLSVQIDATGRDANKQVAKITGSLASQVKDGGLAGALNVELDATDVDTLWIDGLIGQDGLVSGLCGPQVTLTARTDLSQAHTRLLTSVTAQRLKTQKPATIDLLDDRIVLVEPMTAVWRVNPDFFAHYILQDNDVVALKAVPTVSLTLNKLKLSRGAGPFEPGVFSVDALVQSKQLDLGFDGPLLVTYTDLSVHVEDGSTPDAIKFSATVNEGGRQVLALSGEADDLADATGALTLQRAVVSLDAALPNGRTDVIDAVIDQGGFLKELLGPSVGLTVGLDRYSNAGGTVKGTVNATRATLELDGVVGFGEFVASKPVDIRILQVTPELGAMLMKGLPLGSIEKLPEDGPATVTATNLHVPIDGDLSKLVGDVTIDIGVARFQTSSAFAAILDMTRQKNQGFVGRQLDPLTVHMKNGVISYDKYTVPLGEFKIQTEAKSIDLVTKRMDIVTWIPIGALGDEAAGKFNTGLGSALGRAFPTLDKLTNVPWRTTGSFSSPTTLPAPQLFLQNTGSQLMRPDKLIRDRIKDLFGGG